MNELTREEVQQMIGEMIRQHEIRAAVISGIMGGSVVIGLIHAIWLNHIS